VIAVLRVNFMYDGDKLLPNNAVLYNQYLKDRLDILEHDFSRRIIAEIDKSTVLSSRKVQSPFLGEISGTELSGGTKGVLVMRFVTKVHNYYFRGEGFGSNCVPYMLEVAETVDIKLSLSHLMEFPVDGVALYIENSDRLVTTYNEYFADYVKYCASRK